MLVNSTWFQGVVGQDGMKPKGQMRWPLYALRHRNTPKLSLEYGTEKDLEALAAEYPQASNLKLTACNLQGIQQLPSMPQLTTMVCLCRGIHNLRFDNLPSLTSIDVDNCVVSKQLIASITNHLPHLTSLKLSGVDDDDVKRLSSIEALETLGVARCITDVGAQHISKLQHLTWLNMGGSQRVTDVASPTWPDWKT